MCSIDGCCSAIERRRIKPRDSNKTTGAIGTPSVPIPRETIGRSHAAKPQHLRVNPYPVVAMDPATRTRFLKFSGIGVIAFLIDAVVFQTVLSLWGASPYAARAVSFVVATSAAWWLNRTFTFRDADNLRPDLQWARFFAANLVGGAVNYAAFAVMIATFALAAAYPVLALAAGSLCGVSFNFAAYRRYVFRTDAGL